MKLGCALAGHRAGHDPVYNSGYYFCACSRCGEPLIRGAHDTWRTVPTGHRVVWKSGRHCHSLAADFDGLLPIISPELHLPARPSPFVSWCRDLVEKVRPARRRAAAAAAAADAQEDDYRYPGLLLAAVLVGAGLRLLLGFGADR